MKQYINGFTCPVRGAKANYKSKLKENAGDIKKNMSNNKSFNEKSNTQKLPDCITFRDKSICDYHEITETFNEVLIILLTGHIALNIQPSSDTFTFYLPISESAGFFPLRSTTFL